MRRSARIDFDHTQGDGIAFFENFLGVFDALLADFGDVDQTFQVFFKVGKCAELGQAGEEGFHQHTDLVARGAVRPGVVLQLADGQANAFLFAVDADNLDLDILPDFEHFTGMAGWVATQGVSTALPDLERHLGRVLRTPAQGGDTALWLAAKRPAPVPGALWFDRAPRAAHAYDFSRKPEVEPDAIYAKLAADVAKVRAAARGT